MIPFGNETVTLVVRSENIVSGRTQVSYSTKTRTGCSWMRTARVERVGEVMVPQEGIVCRVPADQRKPQVGDLMILGDVVVTVQSGADYQKLIERYRGTDGAFVVASVTDNARPGMPMPHYAARGE